MSGPPTIRYVKLGAWKVFIIAKAMLVATPL